MMLTIKMLRAARRALVMKMPAAKANGKAPTTTRSITIMGHNDCPPHLAHVPSNWAAKPAIQLPHARPSRPVAHVPTAPPGHCKASRHWKTERESELSPQTAQKPFSCRATSFSHKRPAEQFKHFVAASIEPFVVRRLPVEFAMAATVPASHTQSLMSREPWSVVWPGAHFLQDEAPERSWYSPGTSRMQSAFKGQVKQMLIRV